MSKIHIASLVTIFTLLAAGVGMHFDHKSDKRAEAAATLAMEKRQKEERDELEEELREEIQMAVKITQLEGKIKALEKELWNHTQSPH